MIATPFFNNVTKGGMIKLHREGMPESVNDFESWCRYWGMCPCDFAGHIGVGEPPMREEKWIEGEFEYTRSETGSLTRRIREYETGYSMPEFIEFDVRDRDSWEKVKTFGCREASAEKLAGLKQRYRGRTRPLIVNTGSTWGNVRSLMGPERALTAIYDDPDLVREMIAHGLGEIERFVFPVIEALRPEAVSVWEDCCYNHGMMISPAAFRSFCGGYYRRVAEFARANGVELLIVDSDGKVDQFCPLLEDLGFNGCWPMEVVCGNPLRLYRQRQPKLIMAGGIEKGICNSGMGCHIESELIPKVQQMLEKGGYFPMFDHALQTLVGFEELCRAMTLLHRLCGNDLGEYPRR